MPSCLKRLGASPEALRNFGPARRSKSIIVGLAHLTQRMTAYH